MTDTADAARVIAWATETPRRPANLAFTAGPERQAAYWIEWAEQKERERWRAHIAVTLRGIDREQTEDRAGWCWWETSQGAAFGADVLRRALAGPPTAQAPASPADAAPAP